MELIGINAELTHFPGADPEILEGGGGMHLASSSISFCHTYRTPITHEPIGPVLWL